MANCYNVSYGILIASAWCTLVCCNLMHTSGDIFNQGNQDSRNEYGDSSESNVVQKIYSQGDGDSFIMYDDCADARITTTITAAGDGDTYLMYGFSSASSARSPSIANYPEIWPQNMYNQGSGDMYVQFGSCSYSSDSALVQDVYNLGSGDIKIMYASYDRSNVGHKITNVGSGNVFVKYSVTGSYAERKTNIDEQLAHNIYNLGTGKVYTIYENRGGETSNMAKNTDIGTKVNGFLSNKIENLFEMRSRRGQVVTK